MLSRVLFAKYLLLREAFGLVDLIPLLFFFLLCIPRGWTMGVCLFLVEEQDATRHEEHVGS